MNTQIRTVLFTGGHVTPALAVIDILQKEQSDVRILFAGRSYTEKSNIPSFEYQEITHRKIPFFHIRAGRMNRSVSLATVVEIVKIPLGFFDVIRVLLREKPNLIVSFGGYIALPVSIVSSLFGIPIVTHEQTIRPGLANRIIGHLAKRVFTSFPESAQYFSKGKVEVSGNPMRRFASTSEGSREQVESSRPLIYVTGGSLGSHAINTHIEHILPTLLASYHLVHQTGNIQEYGDFERLTQLKKTLPHELAREYEIFEHVDSEKVGKYFKNADLIVTRSGANTFFEIILFQKPAILIPLPWSAFDEQRLHAHILKNAGVADIFEQEDDSQKLLTMIQSIVSTPNTYGQSFSSLARTYSTNGAHTLAQAVAQELHR